MRAGRDRSSRSLWQGVRAFPLSPEEKVRPAAFLRAGTVDATTLLVLRVLRRAVWPMITAGAAFAWVNGDFTAQSLEMMSSPQQFVAAVLSPLVLFALGWALRIVVNLTGLVLAAPLAMGAWVAGTEAVSRGRRLMDLAYLSAGYRSVRWSYAVQQEAVRRCGTLGRQLWWLETVGRIALPVSIAVLVWVLVRDVAALSDLSDP
ncbi:hypothetical protein ACNHYB_04025 [Isoptericola jiangsuensis]|uniref:hypothetical protein n=1 Tax=Isoptericola jiangsuensis TaxID=548579 RepID=UPI003AADEF42